MNIITFDTGANACTVPVPAPGFALVYMTPQALQESSLNTNGQVTFGTTAATVTLKNTVTIDPSVLAMSNGHRGANQQLGSTSFGSGSSGATGMMTALPVAAALACMIIGATLVGRSLSR